MSDDLIKRSDVYKAVDDWFAGRVPNLNIKDIPSADTEIEIINAEAFAKGIDSERKRISDWCRPSGEWLKDKHKNIWDMVVGCYRCSNCGIKAIDHSLIMDTKGLKFCPNCGAKMKGAADDL